MVATNDKTTSKRKSKAWKNAMRGDEMRKIKRRDHRIRKENAEFRKLVCKIQLEHPTWLAQECRQEARRRRRAEGKQ